MNIRITFEKTECSRCGGSGHYSYCQRFGTVCFKCQGSGKQFSRKGNAARKAIEKFLEENYSKPIEEIVAGDKVKVTSGRGFSTALGAATTSTSRFKSGNSTEWVNYLKVEFKTHTHNFAPGCLVQCRPTADQFTNEVLPKARRFSGVTIHENGAS